MYGQITAQTEIVDCTFIGNEAGNGGGLYASSSICRGLIVQNNTAWGNGGGMKLFADRCWVDDSIFSGNQAGHNGGGIWVDMNCNITGCTLVGNHAGDYGGGLYSSASWDYPTYPDLENCLIAFNSAGISGGGVINSEIPTLSFACCDLFGNTPGNYGGMNDHTGQNGNISEDPLFCEPKGGSSFTLRDDSPCAAKNNDCALLIGAVGIDCSATVTAPSSWSRIKTLY